MTADRCTGTACEKDPEQWFDPRRRRDSLLGCLRCPVRKECAAVALKMRPTAGMWAGIWMSGDSGAAQHYLRALAEDTDVAAVPALHAQPVTAPPERQIDREPPEVTSTAPELILARASGHCEIMAPGCNLTLDIVCSRYARAGRRDAEDPASAYGACRFCKCMLADMEPRIAMRLGYLVRADHAARDVPLFWRQHRWLFLTSTGHLDDRTPEKAPNARTS
jgi:hypothetical protein